MKWLESGKQKAYLLTEHHLKINLFEVESGVLFCIMLGECKNWMAGKTVAIEMRCTK